MINMIFFTYTVYHKTSFNFQLQTPTESIEKSKLEETMANTEVEVEVEVEVEGTQRSEMQLKHLQFVRVIAINTAVIVSNLYDYAKQNSGPLKSTVGTVENAVTAIVCPVYEKFKGVYGDLLVFLDNKLDEGTYKFDEYAPPLAKKVVSKTQSLVKKASQIAYDLAEETKVGGPGAALSRAGTMSKHFAMSQLAIVWYKVDHYPALHGLTQMAVPTTAYLSEKYNKLVKDMMAKGYSVFGYLPLVPIEEMARAYKKVETAAAKKEDASSSSESESDKD